MPFSFVRTPDPVYLETDEEAEAFAERYAACEVLGFDTETTGLDKFKDRIKFFSFSDGDTRICAPVRLLPFFKNVLEDEAIAKRMTNAKYDMHMAMNHGIHIKGILEDTVPMDWLLDENRRHGLKFCAADYLGLRMAPFKDVFGAVGKIEKEVKMVTRMHDALEAKDTGYALELLVAVGKVEGDEELIKDLKKVSRYLTDYREESASLLTASALLSIARRNGLCPTTRTRLGYVSDFFELLGEAPIQKETRGIFKDCLQEEELLELAHEIVVHTLSKEVATDLEPLEMVRLLVGDYASLDAWASYTLAEKLQELLAEIPQFEGSEASLLDYYYSHTAKFVRTLWNMERRGFALDLDEISQLIGPMTDKVNTLSRHLVRLAGWDINPNSSKQMKELFYSKNEYDEWQDPFGRRPQFWTKGGSSGVKNPSTGKEAIESWAEEGHELSEVLLEYRQFEKLRSGYLTKLPTHTDNTGRIHTDLKAAGTVSGRLSSSDPNLQNIPSRGEWGTRLRKLFIAGYFGDCADCTVDSLESVDLPDYAYDQEMTLIVADYEQLEMRIMAHMSQDPTMIETIKEGKDLHSMTAALAGGYNYDEIVAAKKADDPTQEQKDLIEVRANMKAVGFGLLYGIGAVKLGRQLGLEVEENRGRRGRKYLTCPDADNLINTYFSIYPHVRRFIDTTHDLCEENIYVQTIMGRRRRLTDILSRDKWFQSRARRQSVNSIIQGSAADIAIQAMLNCEYSKELRKLGARMLLQIHDELVFEVPKIPEVVDLAKPLIRDLMENPIPMSVPILVSMDEAQSWGEAK